MQYCEPSGIMWQGDRVIINGTVDINGIDERYVDNTAFLDTYTPH